MTEAPLPLTNRARAAARFGLAVSAAITAYAVLAYAALRPLHEQGVLQPFLAFLQGFDHLLQAPGLGLAQRTGLRTGHHTTATAWAFSVTVNAVLYFLAAFALRAVRREPSTPGTPAETGAPAPAGRTCSRRGFLTWGAYALGAGAGATLGYALVLEPRRFVIARHTIALRGLPRALDGLRLVQLTDIHHGPWLSLGYVRAVVEAANGLEPDLVCLTGDYVHHSAAYIDPVVAELARLRPRVASVAVLGNHDWWEDVERMRAALAATEVVLLDNDRRVLTPGRRLVAAAAEGLAVCGVGDLWEDRPDYARALGGLPETLPRLLLSHNPDVAEEPGLVGGGLRVDLMLSGHTHGGQVVLPGVGAPITSSHYGQKYARGLVQGPACPVFVCPGIGVSGLPLRFGVPPEIAVLELRTAVG
jgi:predicted MPP superfamily phosphohydrolase